MTTIIMTMKLSRLTFPECLLSDGHCSEIFTSPDHSVRDVLLFPSLLVRTLVHGEAKPLVQGDTELGEESRTS